MRARRSVVGRSIVPSLHESNSAMGCGRCRRVARRATSSRCVLDTGSCRHRRIPIQAAMPAARPLWFFQIRRAPSEGRSRQHLYQLHLPEEFTEQHMKMMNTVFTLDRITPPVIGRRVQASLNVFAESNIFVLHFIAKRDGALDAFLIFLWVHFMEK